MTIKDDGNMRSFDTGATRDTGEGKLDFEGFFSPAVMHQYARFMNMNRLQSDGNLRDSDNWQKGIPRNVYVKSAYRHFFEWWTEHREEIPDKHAMMSSMCGLMFNVMGYMHELLKVTPEVRFDDDEPTPEMAERKKKLAKKDAVRDYNEAMTIQLSPIQPGEVPLPSMVCTCPPGDCDCDTGRIYGFAMPECDRSNQDEDGSCPYCDLPDWKCHCDVRDDEDADVEESCCSCLHRKRPGDQLPCLGCDDDCDKYTRED